MATKHWSTSTTIKLPRRASTTKHPQECLVWVREVSGSGMHTFAVAAARHVDPERRTPLRRPLKNPVKSSAVHWNFHTAGGLRPQVTCISIQKSPVHSWRPRVEGATFAPYSLDLDKSAFSNTVAALANVGALVYQFRIHLVPTEYEMPSRGKDVMAHISFDQASSSVDRPGGWCVQCSWRSQH